MRVKGLLLIVTCALLLCAAFTARAAAQGGGCLSLYLDGEEIRILRDGYGVPHVFAASNRALFYGYGYAVAEDRLWQLDLYRRAARGRLAEILGAFALPSDQGERLHGYTAAEYESLYASLPAETQGILTAYRDGINAYIQAAIADPANRLPWEFQQLAYQPSPWEIADTLAIGRFMTSRFGEIGGQELRNEALRQSLIAAHGAYTGTRMFNDLRWPNDPDAPTTAPSGSYTPTLTASATLLPGIEGIAASLDAERGAVREVWARYGIPATLGSYAWAVSPARSATGNALLLGGPQMGFFTPDIVHEIQISGGQGFDVGGISFPGVPLVLIGRNRQVAWSVTTGMGDNTDVYVEALNPLNHDVYRYRSNWATMITRTETIRVLGQPDQQMVVRRTVHGPVIAVDEANHLAYSLRRAHWMKEPGMFAAMLAVNRATGLADFQQGVAQYAASNHFIYADVEGNIAYWQAGLVPIRPGGGHVGRLPWVGDGSEEWREQYRALPHALNPAQGFLANWNNKAVADFDNGDAVLLGEQDRISDITDRLAADDSISVEDMLGIVKDIAAYKWFGNETRYLRDYLLAAIAAEAPGDARVQEAGRRLAAWDGRFTQEVVSDTLLSVGEEIWNHWLTATLANTFADELGAFAGEANLNTLLHALDGATSGVPPARDYFDNIHTPAVETANQVLVASLRQALDALTALFGTFDMSDWQSLRPVTVFAHPLGTEIGQIPTSNRSTYLQIIELGRPMAARNILPLGQSGFIKPDGAPSAHFGDQLALYRQFQLKPMPQVSLSLAHLPAILKK